MSKTVYHLCTYKPEQCGIASWTEDTINYSQKENPRLRNRVIAVNGFRRSSEYADPVDYCMEKDRKEGYIEAAKFANENADLVSIQHEFGIFGGERGERTGDYLLYFLDSLKVPKLLTAHTVLGNVNRDKRAKLKKEVFKEILPKVDHIMAISQTAKDILERDYGVDPKKVTMIYHGVHDFEESPEHSRQVIGDLEGRFVLSTVGLVRKKRGFEHVIKSLPLVIKKHPDLLYLIAGKTHPKEIGLKGEEQYRDMLKKEVEIQNLSENVRFVNQWLPLSSLLRYIRASDIAITPYTDPNQISSGVLSYNLGLGVPVISTPFAYAKEILADGRGVILPDFNNPESIAKALLEILENREKVLDMSNKIEPLIKKMKWSAVARKYIEAEEKLIESVS